MLTIRYSALFRKDYKRVIKRGYNPKLLAKTVRILASEKALPPRYRDHKLSGDYVGFNECHITPDWLLVYRINASELILQLTRTGTHGDLF